MTDAIQKAREARFHIDRMNAWLRELWEAKSLTLHMSDGTTRSDMFGLLQNIRSDVMAIRDSALAALDAETEVKVAASVTEAANIGDAVLAWMVKFDLLDADNEYYAADVLAVLDDLTTGPLVTPGARS